MKEQELLDDGFDDENANLLDAVQWWEKKRILYNILLFSLELLLVGIYWDGMMLFGIGSAIIGIISHNIVANMFYTIGWGIEILFLYYFKIKSFGNVRFALYIMGVLFSFLWAWVAYIVALSTW
jgi:hypothetical protein